MTIRRLAKASANFAIRLGCCVFVFGGDALQLARERLLSRDRRLGRG